MQFNAEKAQPLTDARAHEWCIFADASCEDERVQSTQRRGEGADPLFRLITKQQIEASVCLMTVSAATT